MPRRDYSPKAMRARAREARPTIDTHGCERRGPGRTRSYASVYGLRWTLAELKLNRRRNGWVVRAYRRANARKRWAIVARGKTALRALRKAMDA